MKKVSRKVQVWVWWENWKDRLKIRQEVPIVVEGVWRVCVCVNTFVKYEKVCFWGMCRGYQGVY